MTIQFGAYYRISGPNKQTEKAVAKIREAFEKANKDLPADQQRPFEIHTKDCSYLGPYLTHTRTAAAIYTDEDVAKFNRAKALKEAYYKLSSQLREQMKLKTQPEVDIAEAKARLEAAYIKLADGQELTDEELATLTDDAMAQTVQRFDADEKMSQYVKQNLPWPGNTSDSDSSRYFVDIWPRDSKTVMTQLRKGKFDVWNGTEIQPPKKEQAASSTEAGAAENPEPVKKSWKRFFPFL